MRVGIVTFQGSVSYGAFLQCFALQQALLQMGHDVRVIDFHPNHRADKAGLRWSESRGPFRRANILRIQQMLKFKLSIRKSLKLTSRRFRSFEDLGAACRDFDAIVCGSDQIWNASHTGGAFDPAYFGAFAPPGVKRVAYAASLGTDTIDEAHHAEFVRLAGGMHSVSLREESGRVLAQRLLGRPVSQMPDPTFLYSGFPGMLLAPTRARAHIFSFRMQASGLFDTVLREATERHGIGTVHVRDNLPLAVSDVQQVTPTPQQWLGLIASASHVVSNSFHAIALSVILQRPFTAVGLSGAAQARSERIVALLQKFRLSQLYCERPDEIAGALTAAGAIDWAAVSTVLAEERRRGIAFLASALSA